MNGKNKNIQINIRMSLEEKAELESIAERIGVPPALIARHGVLDKLKTLKAELDAKKEGLAALIAG